MGNCYQDSRVMPSSKTEMQVQPNGLSQIPNQVSTIVNTSPNNPSLIISELRSLPPIPKTILNQMDRLGPFLQRNSNTNMARQFGKIYQLKNNNIYQGNIIDGKFFEGPGRLMLADGTVLQSEFVNGEPKGKTRIFKPNGDYFSGKIQNSEEPYQGIVHEKGITYIGQMLKQKPHGQGKQKSRNYTFAGTYSYGKKVSGLFQWNLQNPQAKQSYEGGFQNNQFEGQGIMKNIQGKYTGSFQKGMKWGEGIFQYANGEKYVGNFRKNKPDGQGKLYGVDGTLLREGKWLNGKYYVGQSS